MRFRPAKTALQLFPLVSTIKYLLSRICIGYASHEKWSNYQAGVRPRLTGLWCTWSWSNRQFQKVAIVGTSVSCPLSCRRQSTCAAPHLFLEDYKPRRSGLRFMQEPYQGAKFAHTGRPCHIRYCLLHQRCEDCSINTLWLSFSSSPSLIIRLAFY